MKEFIIENLSDYKLVAEQISKELAFPILLLRGNLGAGKTTFTANLLKILGSNDDVSSPTYAIINEYSTPKGRVSHFDLYRLNSPIEVMEIGIEDYLASSYLSIIEWPEVYLEELEGLNYHEIEINVEGEKRILSFK